VSYERLYERFRRLGQLAEVSAIVEWDQAVNMPEAAGASRAQAIAALTRMRHELLTDGGMQDWLAAASEQRDLGTWERANVREMQRVHARAHAIPGDLVEASANADKTSEQAWRRFRAENDFASYAPYLEQVVSLKRQVGQALASALELSVYDALMDEFEPGGRSADIDRVFAPLEAFLPDFTEAVIERQRYAEVIEPAGPFPVRAQRQLALELMPLVGFDLERGRLDVSHHPFCGGVPEDVRITTRYDESNFTSALMGVLHECGHGKYEQALPTQWANQPVGMARGMVLHESQSLLLEMQVCRSDAFLRWAAPRICAAFAEQCNRQPQAFALSNLRALYGRVRPSLIRVDADEVTYPAHVLLRYQLERALIDGSLAVRELPEAWNERMQALLGLSTSGNDKDGCMQDVHWPSGAFGYFPLYTLGAMVAAQLFSGARQAHPDLEAQIARGDFKSLDAWLRAHVWSQASVATTEQVLQACTGEGLNPQWFIRHLQNRYIT
jgi:carboxypeptidase Taq